MKNWHNLSEKIPKINTYIFILSKDFKEIYYGKLVVYLNSMEEDGGFFDYSFEEDEEHGFLEGDLFWEMYGNDNDIDDNILWDTIEAFPYWITLQELIEVTINKEEDSNEEINNRADILDL